jgi:hypothetical protein
MRHTMAIYAVPYDQPICRKQCRMAHISAHSLDFVICDSHPPCVQCVLHVSNRHTNSADAHSAPKVGDIRLLFTLPITS